MFPINKPCNWNWEVSDKILAIQCKAWPLLEQKNLSLSWLFLPFGISWPAWGWAWIQGWWHLEEIKMDKSKGTSPISGIRASPGGKLAGRLNKFWPKIFSTMWLYQTKTLWAKHIFQSLQTFSNKGQSSKNSNPDHPCISMSYILRSSLEYSTSAQFTPQVMFGEAGE